MTIMIFHGDAFVRASATTLLCLGPAEVIDGADCNKLSDMVRMAMAMHDYVAIKLTFRRHVHLFPSSHASFGGVGTGGG